MGRLERFRAGDRWTGEKSGEDPQVVVILRKHGASMCFRMPPVGICPVFLLDLIMQIPTYSGMYA